MSAILLALPTAPACADSQNACRGNTQVEDALRKGGNSQLSPELRKQAYEDAIRQCPHELAAYNNLSVLLLQNHDLTGALSVIHRGLQIAPRDSALNLDWGVALLALGKPEKALPVLKSLPSTPKGEFYLGMAYRALRDHKAAQQALSESFKTGYDDPYVLYALIEQDQALHDKAAGLRDFRTFSERFPNSAWLHLLLGNAYASQHDESNAETEYRKAADLDPKLPIVHFKLGRIAFDRSHYPEALTDFQKEIAVNPAFGEAYLYLGTCLRRMGETSKALSYLQQAVKRDPNYALGYRELAVAQIESGQTKAAVETLQEGEQRFPKEAAFPAQLAQLQKKLGDASEAAKEAQLAERLSRQNNPGLGSAASRAVHGAPAQSSPAVQRLSQCVKSSDAQCAAEALSQIHDEKLERDPGFLDLKARALNLLHKRKAALEAIQSAIKIDPKTASYFLTKGQIQQRAGDQPGAIRSFLQAEQLRPGFADPVYYLGMSFFLLGNDNNDNAYYNRAARHFKAALSLNPRDDKAEFMLGVVNVVEFKLSEAQKDFERALKLSPKNPYYHLHYGVLLSRIGDRSGALREMKIAEKLDPSYARTHFHLGDLDAQMGSFREAQKQLEAAVRLDPHLSAAYYSLGSVYHHLGLTEKSRKAYEEFQKAKAQERQNEGDPVEASVASAESRSAAKNKP
ncbi:MAG TPA: tetratricopeptide repeat protein [Terriglobia bacterium]|nr:tetratricopeptide repeat protein [Terriglobia bacterium]